MKFEVIIAWAEFRGKAECGVSVEESDSLNGAKRIAEAAMSAYGGGNSRFFDVRCDDVPGGCSLMAERSDRFESVKCYIRKID